MFAILMSIQCFNLKGKLNSNILNEISIDPKCLKNNSFCYVLLFISSTQSKSIKQENNTYQMLLIFIAIIWNWPQSPQFSTFISHASGLINAPKQIHFSLNLHIILFRFFPLITQYSFSFFCVFFGLNLFMHIFCFHLDTIFYSLSMHMQSYTQWLNFLKIWRQMPTCMYQNDWQKEWKKSEWKERKLSFRFKELV